MLWWLLLHFVVHSLLFLAVWLYFLLVLRVNKLPVNKLSPTPLVPVYGMISLGIALDVPPFVLLSFDGAKLDTRCY